MLELQPGILLSEQLIGGLRDLLNYTPAAVAAAVERSIRNPAAYANVGEMATAAGVPRRSFYRHLERAGLASPRELLAGARVLRAYALLRVPGSTLEQVSAQLGFSDVDGMAESMKALVGITPGRARVRVAPDEFVRLVMQRLRSPGVARPMEPPATVPTNDLDHVA
jgi:AraC-like DNA-binding protein